MEKGNTLEAIDWFQLAAGQDDPEGLYQMGKMCWEGAENVEQNQDTGLIHLLAASRLGHVDASKMAASIFEEKGMKDEAAACLRKCKKRMGSSAQIFK